MEDGAKPRFVGVSELLWDCGQGGWSPGGAPANVAAHAHQWGCEAAVVSRVGGDPEGRELVAALRSRGVDTSAVQIDPLAPTGGVSLKPSARGEAEVRVHEGVAWERLEADEPARRAVAEADALCFGTLIQRHPVAERALFNLLEASPALKVYDINLRQNWWTPARVRRSLRLADIAKLNQEEAALLGPRLGFHGSDPRDFCRKLRDDFSLQAVCLTRGGDGCWVGSATEEFEVPGFPVGARAARSAGDSFTAAFASAWLEGQPLPIATAFAARVGALHASRSGATLSLEEPLGELHQQMLAGRG